MPDKFESLFCEVNPEQTYSTYGSSFDENLKGVNFLRGILIWIKFLIVAPLNCPSPFTNFFVDIIIYI